MSTFHEEAGKGSWKRPREVSKETYESNWDKIFGKKEKQQEENPVAAPSGDVPVGE